jgi:agmatine/peptidylarginine deiminase
MKANLSLQTIAKAMFVWCLILLSTASTLNAQKAPFFQRNPNADQKQLAQRNQALKTQLTAKPNTSGAQAKNLTGDPLPADARFAAQFEECQGVVMTWAYDQVYDSTFTQILEAYPFGDTLWGKISCDLANAIQSNATVVIRVFDYADTTAILQIMSDRGTPLYNYTFYQLAIDSWWDRDSGPVCFYYSDQDSIAVLDMDYYTFEAVQFNGDPDIYTDYNEINVYNRIHDDSIPIAVSQLYGYPLYKTSLNNEGGNLIFDGLGTTWTSTRTREQNVGNHFGWTFDPVTFEIFIDSSVTIWDNYPELDDAGYEDLLVDAYQSTTLIEPITLDCDGGTGHLDLYLKLIDDNRLGISDYSQAIYHTDYEDWATNVAEIATLTDANGMPYNTQTIPMPLSEGEVPQLECEIDQRTYINGIFVNKSFIMPIFSDPADMKASDVEAVAMTQKAMPGYNIIPIDAALMYGTGGALHCITHEIPAENPIFMRHTALACTQPIESNYDLTAEIRNKSGIASAKAYYRQAGETTWQSVNLVAGTDNQFSFALPGTGLAALDTMEYYIKATSNNGKTITKPFTAEEGGYWRFDLAAPSATNNPTGAFEALKAYPNPSQTGLFTLQGLPKDAQKISYNVINAFGQTLASGVCTNNTIDISNQAKGVYFVRLTDSKDIITIILVRS